MAADLAKAEWKKIKKTKGAHTGTLTKLHNKLLRLFEGDIATYDLKMLGRAMASITKAEEFMSKQSKMRQISLTSRAKKSEQKLRKLPNKLPWTFSLTKWKKSEHSLTK